MRVAIAIILILVLLYYFYGRAEHLEKHRTVAFLIHSATSDQCYECREIKGYFYSQLANIFELTLYDYHVRDDHAKVRDLENKYNFTVTDTPVLVVVDDDGTHKIFKGYKAVREEITLLRYHPYLERTLNL